MNKKNLTNKETNFLLYTGYDGEVKVNGFLKDETVWLTQKAIGQLFGKSKATISVHLKKIYEEGELELDPTVRKFRTVQTEGAISILEIARNDAELRENSVCAYFAHTVAEENDEGELKTDPTIRKSRTVEKERKKFRTIRLLYIKEKELDESSTAEVFSLV